MQLPLDEIEGQETLLAGIGGKLIEVGFLATGHEFDASIQAENASRLARIAADRNLEVDARRLYIKTWVSLLEKQRIDGERELYEEELSLVYQGAFDSLHRAVPDEFEP